MNAPDHHVVFVHPQCLVHELEKVWRRDEIVLEHDHPSKLGAHRGHAADDGFGQPEIRLALYDPERPESGHRSRVLAHLAHGQRSGAVPRPVGKHDQVALRRQMVAAQRLDRLPGVPGTVIDEQCDRGLVQAHATLPNSVSEDT